MEKYHKINTIFKRDETNRHKSLIMDDYSCPEVEYLKNNRWILSEKIDGTNIRVQFDGNKRSFLGKTDDSQIHNKLYTYLEEVFTIENLKKFFTGDFKQACLYGEGFGPGIQKGGEKYSSTQQFCLFDIWIDGWWLSRTNVERSSVILGVDCPVIVDIAPLSRMIELCRNGFNSSYGDFIAEGIVAKPEVDLFNRDGERIVTKLKYKDFALERIQKSN